MALKSFMLTRKSASTYRTSSKSSSIKSTNQATNKTWLRLLLVLCFVFSLFSGTFSVIVPSVKAAPTANVNFVASTVATTTLSSAVVSDTSSLSTANSNTSSATISPTQSAVTHKGTLASHADPQQLLHLSISLKERNPQAETQFIQDLYNPNSSNFHHYLTPAQYGQKFGPTAATRAQVANYLTSQGFKITQNNPNGTLINFDGTVSQAEKAFQLSINNYTNPATNRTFYGNDRTPALPIAIANSVVGVIGLSSEIQPKPQFALPNKDKKQPSASPASSNSQPLTTPDGKGFSPTEIRNAYDVTPLYNNGYQGQGQRVALYEADGYDPADIAVYTSTLGLNPPAPIITDINGIPTFSQDGLYGQAEVELDIEAVYAVAPKAQILLYFGDLFSTYQQIASDDSASEISTSWAMPEDAMLPSQTQQEQQIFRQFALQGQSFYAAAGDDDSYYYPAYFNQQGGYDPAVQPYVTAVGGTSLYISGTETTATYNYEAAWNYGFEGTGGGLSTHFFKGETPWQIGPGTDLSSTYNPNGYRQAPDVSAVGDPGTGLGVYTNVSGGGSGLGFAGGGVGWTAIGGTSLSSPLWAAFNALANQCAVNSGGSTVGFANPVLYSIFNDPDRYARDFHDVIYGTNDKNCSGYSPTWPQCLSDSVYYKATTGYDLATGIGTSDVANLANDLATISRGSQLLATPSLIVLGAGNSPFATSYSVTLDALKQPVSYTISGIPQWLTVSNTTGIIVANGSQTITVTANAGNLSTGLYTAHLLVSDTNNSHNFTYIDVQLEVNQVLGRYSTNTIVLNYDTGDAQPPVYTLTVTLPYTVNFTVSPGGRLLVSPMSGTIPANVPTVITVTSRPQGFQGSWYTGFAIFNTDDPYDHTYVYVILNVYQDVYISNFYPTFPINYNNYTDPPAQPIIITTSASAHSTVTMTMNLSDGDWFDVTPRTLVLPPGSSAVVTVTLNMSVQDHQNLIPGEYYGYIIAAQNNGMAYPVDPHLIVYGVSAKPSSVSFSAIRGNWAPGYDVNLDTNPLSTITSISTTVPGIRIINLGNPNNYQPEFYVDAESEGLAAGVYSGTINIQTDKVGPTSVPVIFTVQERIATFDFNVSVPSYTSANGPVYLVIDNQVPTNTVPSVIELTKNGNYWSTSFQAPYDLNLSYHYALGDPTQPELNSAGVTFTRGWNCCTNSPITINDVVARWSNSPPMNVTFNVSVPSDTPSQGPVYLLIDQQSPTSNLTTTIALQNSGYNWSVMIPISADTNIQYHYGVGNPIRAEINYAGQEFERSLTVAYNSNLSLSTNDTVINWNNPVTITPTDTTPMPTDTTPTPTDTTPMPTDTTPTPTDTTPTSTETETTSTPTDTTNTPVATDTTTAPTETTPTLTSTIVAPTSTTPTPAITTPAPTATVPITPTSYTYSLPFLANNAMFMTNGDSPNHDTYTTYLALQNIGSGIANVKLQYYDLQGNPTGYSGNVCATLPLHGECIPTALPVGTVATGVITSDQPLSVIVAEATPYGGSAYAVSEGSNTVLYAPFAMNNAFGGFSTRLTIYNTGDQPTSVQLNFTDNNGNFLSVASHNFNLNPHTFAVYDQAAANSNLPSGFHGWASIAGNVGSQIVAQVLEQNPNTGFAAILNAVPYPTATQLYAPVILNNGFGSFVTGASLINVGAEAISATVSYYTSAGNLLKSVVYNVPTNGIADVYNGGNNSDVPSGFVGSAVISSSIRPLIMAVNESGGGGARQSGVYLAAGSGVSSVGLPVMAKNGLGYTTGATILNTSDQPVTVSLQYYNLDGTIAGSGVGSQSVTIGANASYAVYQGAAALGDGFYGSAMVNETSGPPNALLITTNAQSSNFFYTYMEPN